MRTVIGNRIYIYNVTMDLYWFVHDNLVVVNPDYDKLMSLGKGNLVAQRHIPQYLNLFVESGSNMILPFGTLYAIWKYIKDYPYELKFNDNGQVIDPNLKISAPLYDYQEEAVEDMIKARGGILEGSCGCGKTQIGIEIAKRIGKNTLWCCHTSDLLNQTVARIHMLYPDIPVGTITQGEIKMVMNGITVATIQTLSKMDTDLYRDKFDVVIGDEIHRCIQAPTLRKMYGKIMDNVAARYKYGLSATLTRADTMIKSMYAYVGCNTKGEFAPVIKIDRSKTRTLTAKHIRVDLDTPFSYDCLNEDGTFNYPTLIEFLSNNKERNERIVKDSIEALPKHKKQIILCQRIDQCKILHQMLVDRGVSAVILTGDSAKKQRKTVLEGKEWSVLVATYALAKEGLDIPELSLLIMGMITCDKVATVQSVGRVERVFDGKPDPEVYDYVDTRYPYCIGKYNKRALWLKRR